ncbi:MAG: AMP-binding protein, partial [Gammaproteobacteria bacterium]
NPGALQKTESSLGEGWYDTGDIVHVDDNGYVQIRGRAKRFAKVGGEMISLAVVEELSAAAWPEALHAAVAVPDEQKGERIVLVTTQAGATRKGLLTAAKERALSELHAPRDILVIKSLPLLASGKTDYPAVGRLVEQEISA